MELNILLLREEFHTFDIPPNCDLPQLGYGFIFWWILCLSFFSLLMLSFYPLLWKLCSLNFQVFFRGNYYLCSCRFVVSMAWEMSSGSCHAAILNPAPRIFIFNLSGIRIYRKLYSKLAFFRNECGLVIKYFSRRIKEKSWSAFSKRRGKNVRLCQLQKEDKMKGQLYLK